MLCIVDDRYCIYYFYSATNFLIFSKKNCTFHGWTSSLLLDLQSANTQHFLAVLVFMSSLNSFIKLKIVKTLSILYYGRKIWNNQIEQICFFHSFSLQFKWTFSTSCTWFLRFKFLRPQKLQRITSPNTRNKFQRFSLYYLICSYFNFPPYFFIFNMHEFYSVRQ